VTLEDLALATARELDAGGWDQPAILYLVIGPLDDPSLLPVAWQVEGHPHDMLDTLPPIPRQAALRGVLGLALAQESWVVRPSPERRAEVLGAARGIWDEGEQHWGAPEGITLEQWLEAAWEQFLGGVPASEHPDRLECRLVHLRTMDGTSVAALHYRGDVEDDVLSTREDGVLGGRMEDQMKRLVRELEGKD